MSCRHRAITDKMLFSLILTASIIEFSQVGSGFIDGLVISRFLGPTAMAALSVRNNFSSFAEIIGAGIAAAISLTTGIYYGEINDDAIDEVYSFGQKLQHEGGSSRSRPLTFYFSITHYRCHFFSCIFIGIIIALE